MTDANWLNRLHNIAFHMREDPTGAEAHMFSRLHDAAIHCEQQKVLDPYIVDFYLPESRTVLEVDGGSHKGHSQRDRKRTNVLLQRPDVARVVRVTNAEAMDASFDLLARLDES